MLSITHRAYSNYSSNKLYKNMGSVELKIDVELVMKDIKKFTEQAEKTRNRTNVENYRSLVSRLEQLLKLVSQDNCLRLSWDTHGNESHTEPIELYSDMIYGFDMCNYIKVDDTHQICVLDTKKMADMIAFEYVAYDLGETHESIEKMFSGLKLVGSNPTNVVDKYFEEDSIGPYLLSKSMKTEKCFHRSGKEILSYFSDTGFKGNDIRVPVAYSCKYANFIIANELLKEHKDKKDIYILAVSEHKITVLINKGTEDLLDENFGVDIKIFGRFFDVTPEIKVY